MSTCRKHHPQYAQFASLPTEPHHDGEIKCAGCAYEMGFSAGQSGQNKALLDYNALPNEKSAIDKFINPQAAFAYGCLLGLAEAKSECV